MRKRAIAAGVVISVALASPCARGDERASGSMPLACGVAPLAAAAGIHRDDPSTVLIDIVRLAFASPDGTADNESGARAAILEVFAKGGRSADRVPLPLSARVWRERILHDNVADDGLAAAIFRNRSTALVYHGLVAMDPPTLEWIDANADALEVLLKHPGMTAAFARSIHIRAGAIRTPGEDAQDVWATTIGADPRKPAAFIAALFAAKDGRAAVFYDAVSHLDAAHQRFALGIPGDPNRARRVDGLLDAVAHESSTWRIDERPFQRPEVDVALLMRLVAVDARGAPAPPSSRRLWARVFGESAQGEGPVDAEWLARTILGATGGIARRRLETFLFAQRALAADAGADASVLAAALRAYHRHAAMMVTLEGSGVRKAATYASAARAASVIGRDDEAIAVFQAGLAIVDRARLAGTLNKEEAVALMERLVDAGTSKKTRAALLVWWTDAFVPALRRARGVPVARDPDAESLVLAAMAGPTPSAPPAVTWEGRQYHVDVAQPELRRLTRIRNGEREMRLDAALAAATPREMAPLAFSLAGIVYAAALGDPDTQAASGGAVWRRHRFVSDGSGPGSEVAWRIATEVFGGAGWHLTGSILRLDLALAHLALQRIDVTEAPPPSLMSTRDRLTLAITVAAIDPLAITDADRDGLAAAVRRGRERVVLLARRPDQVDAVAQEAALSEWRRAAVRWLIVNDSARVPAAFTLLELYRLGTSADEIAPAGWGAASTALDGCPCVHMPERDAWEEYTGRASTGQLATQLADVMLRVAELLAERGLPARLVRGVMAFAMQEVADRARPAYFDDWLSVAFAARDLGDDRFDDFVAALTAAGPLVK